MKFFVKHMYKSDLLKVESHLTGAERAMCEPLIKMGFTRTNEYDESDFLVMHPSTGAFKPQVQADSQFIFFAKKQHKPILISSCCGRYAQMASDGEYTLDDPTVIGIRNAFHSPGNMVKYWEPDLFRPKERRVPLKDLPADDSCLYIGYRRSGRISTLNRMLKPSDVILGGGWKPEDHPGTIRTEEIPYSDVVYECSKFRFIFHCTESIFNSQGILCFRIDEAYRSRRLCFCNRINVVHPEIIPELLLYKSPKEFHEKRKILMDDSLYFKTFDEFSERYESFCKKWTFDPQLMADKLKSAGLRGI
jgi:hypothetical protein